MASTDKSVFTKALELALCCCSEIPVPAAAKAHDAPTRRPNEAERDLAAPALATLGRTRVTDAEFLAVFKKWRKRQAKLDAAAEKPLQKLVSLASARESEATELVTDNGGVVTAP